MLYKAKPSPTLSGASATFPMLTPLHFVVHIKNAYDVSDVNGKSSVLRHLYVARARLENVAFL